LIGRKPLNLIFGWWGRFLFFVVSSSLGLMWRTQEDFLRVACLLLLARRHGIMSRLLLDDGKDNGTTTASPPPPGGGEQLWGSLPLEVVVYMV